MKLKLKANEEENEKWLSSAFQFPDVLLSTTGI